MLGPALHPRPDPGRGMLRDAGRCRLLPALFGLPALKVMIEVDEEVGSENLVTFVAENKEKLKADVVLVSDTAIIANDVPSITVGLRGLSYVEVEVTGPNRDLHSGIYGGAVMNPINVLCDMISSLRDENKRISIPGFYDDVCELSDDERAEMAKAPFNKEEYVSKAINFSRNLDKISTIRKNLRKKLLGSPICNARRFSKNFENILHEIWKNENS